MVTVAAVLGQLLAAALVDQMVPARRPV